MAEKNKESVFSDFTAKAVRRLKDKKVRKHMVLYIPSLDQNITIRNLDYPEVVECTEMEDVNDPNKADKYSVYLAVVEPDLRMVAMELKEQGEIKEYLDVIDIFDMSEVGEIALKVMQLSGYLSNRKVTVVDELKNS